MICSNCGSNIKPGEAFCRNCGSKNPNVQNQNNSNINNVMSNQKSNISKNDSKDEVLIDAYIGKNAEKIKTKKFSLPTLFLGAYYLIYRKIWLYGFVWVIGGSIIAVFLPAISKYLPFAIGVYFAIEFKKIYLKHVGKQVEKIKSENLGKSDAELIAICSRKGGTNVAAAIGAVLLAFVLGFILALPSAFNTASNIEEKVDSTTSEKANNESETNTNTNTNSSSKGLNNLSYNIPRTFTVGNYNSDNFAYYSLTNAEDYCTVSIIQNSADLYKDAKTYLKDHVYYTEKDVVSDVTEKTINNNTWYGISVQTDSAVEHTYAIISGENLYSVEFYMSLDSGNCSSAHTTIINSLKLN